jgi:Aspartyl protease/PDZ domain
MAEQFRISVVSSRFAIMPELIHPAVDRVRKGRKVICLNSERTRIIVLVVWVALCAPCLAQSDGSVRTKTTETASSPVALVRFQLARDHIFVEVIVDHSRPLSMILDSGEPFSAIDDQVASELRFTSERTAPYQGIGNDAHSQAKITERHELDLGGVALKDISLWIMPTREFARPTGRVVDGVLGADLFERYVVEINYEAREIRLYEPEDYAVPHATHVVPLAFVTGWKVPLLQTKITALDGEIANTSLVFDTGSGPNYLSRCLSDANPTMISSGKTLAGPKGFGSNGLSTYLVGRVKEIQIGDLRVTEPVVFFSLDTNGLAAQADYSGSIGGEILEDFTVVVDYKRRTIAFEPNGKFGVRTEYNMSGMHLLSDVSDLHRFEVDFVAPDSVAAGKGVLVGDVVVSVNGKPAKALTLDEIGQLLARPGKIKVRMARGSKKYRLTFMLAPRI